MIAEEHCYSTSFGRKFLQRRYLIRGFAALGVLFAVLSVSDGNAAAGQSPTQVVSAFHEVLLTTMKRADTLDVNGRYEQLAGPVASSYDLTAMTRISCGGYWRRATEQEKQELVTAFSRVSIGTYAVRFNGYSGQGFDILGEKGGPRGTTLVDTQIVGGGDGPIALTYVMKSADDGWRIIDVLLAGGISELAVRRSEYRSILRASGVRGLIGALNKKADRLVGPAG